MANIADKIKQIREAIYGKDVRESIASSLEAVSGESEQAMSSCDAAVKNAASAVSLAGSAVTAADTATANANSATTRANNAASAVETAAKYVWHRFSANSDGADMHENPQATDFYVGEAVTVDNVAPADKTGYKWALFRGADGKGIGDMLKSAYDPSGNGDKVKKAEQADTATKATNDVNNNKIDEYYQLKVVSNVINIPVASWDTTALTVTVACAGMTADTTASSAIVSYDPDTKDIFTAAGIYGSAQGDNTITFKCTTIPTAAVAVNVMVVK